VVIDEFVYDPATNKGNIAATLTQGSFRYIGGKLSKQGNATLKTPVATLGIRGSDVTVGYNSSTTQMNVVTTHGNATLQTGNDVLNLRGGFGTTVSGGQAATPTALSAQQIAAANSQFEGQPGKSAGAGKPPSDGDVAKSGLGSSVEAKGVAATAPDAGPAPAQAALLQVPFTPSNNDTPPVVPKKDEKKAEQSNIPPPPPPPPPSSQPETRVDSRMSGYLAGAGLSTGEGGGSYLVTSGGPNDLQVQTFPSSQGTGAVFAKLTYRPVESGPIESAQVQIGDPSGTAAPGAQSFFLVASTFSATQTSSSGTGLAKVDGANAAASVVLASLPNTKPVGDLTGEPGVGPACTCSYVTWGTWSATLQTSPTVIHSVSRGFWVAGVLPSVSDPSPTGVAMFSGTAIGAVEGQQNPVSGAFTNRYDFSQRTGRVDITNFAGKSFGGPVSAGTDWRNYGGALSGANVTGTLNGSFYGNRDGNGQLQVPKETAGNFNVQGSGFKASGVFLGNR
jgi:hypothetical protein